MTRPISPREVVGEKSRDLPDQVIEAWNRLIARHYTEGAGRGISRVTQEEALQALLPLVPPQGSRQWVIDQGWLDIEPMYRARGWEVRYDRPGYSETYPACFEFRSWVPKR